MHFLHRYSLAIFLCCAHACSIAQADSSITQKKEPSASYINSYPKNTVTFLSFPCRWSTDQWYQFAGSTLLVGTMVTMDEVLNIPFQNWQTDFAEKFGEVGNVVGSPAFQLSLSGAALGVGYISKNKNWQHFALDNLQAQIFTGGITFVIKELTHRARPETGEDNYAWYGPFKGSENKSFFSGHTALSFSTATMVYLHTGRKWWVALLGYSAASAVGISRMQRQKHWASDVVGGALVGTATAQFIYNQQQKRRAQQKRLKALP